MKLLCFNLFTDKKCPFVNGFVKCCSLQDVGMILESIKTQNLRVAGDDDLKIKAALADVDTNRNWVVFFATEETIQATPQA